MATLAELARLGTNLTTRQLLHLQRLVSWWAMLADLSFADLLLLAPSDDAGRNFVIVSQVRPTTSRTLYRDDHVGLRSDDIDRPLVARSFRLGEIVEGEIQLTVARQRARVLCIPVRLDGHVIAVLSRELPTDFARDRVMGELELTYLEIFRRFANMIAAGQFPFRGEEVDTEDVPRIGDGVLVVDTDARLVYSSPNALSSLHRVGVAGNVEGRRLGDLGVDQSVITSALRAGIPFSSEFERHDVTLQMVALPMLDGAEPVGVLVLLRDVSELRRRDRLLLSKDATIREIHHRVKNNLQTISSLLRLQGRRLASEEAKQALDVSVRRIRAISVVHERLANEAGEDVSLNDVVEQLVRTVQEGLVSPDRRIAFEISGSLDVVSSEIVTPLAVVLNELLQNIVDHAYPPGWPVRDDVVGTVEISVDKTGHGDLLMRVVDDGVGVPEDFDIEQQQGLGTSIITALTKGDLNGSISMSRRDDASGTITEVIVPLDVRVDE